MRYDPEWTPDYYGARNSGVPVVCFPGDSQTYLTALPSYPHYFLAAGTPLGTVGSFVDQSASNTYPTWSEGHSSFTTAQLLAALPGYFNSYAKTPTDVLHLCGVNDVATAVAQATTLANIAAIKALFVAQWPGVAFWACQQPGTTGAHAGLNTAITALNAALLAAYPGRCLVVPPDWNATTDTYDGIHHSVAGATKLGAYWRSATGL